MTNDNQNQINQNQTKGKPGRPPKNQNNQNNNVQSNVNVNEEQDQEQVSNVNNANPVDEVDYKKIEEEVRKKVEEEIKEKMKEEAKKELEQEKQKKEKGNSKRAEKIDPNELIPCYSLVYGGLTYRSPKTGLVTRWANYGTVQELEFSELHHMKNSGSPFLKRPWIYIDDERVVNKLNMNELYEKVEPLKDINSLFEQGLDKIKEVIDETPKSLYDLVASKARLAVENGDLKDISIIQMLENKLDIDLRSFI